MGELRRDCVTENGLQAPLVHLNGTGADGLREQLQASCEAISLAAEALRAGAPHGRDYYPLPDGAFEAARAQYYSQLERLEVVRAEIMEVYRAVYAQGGSRD